MNMDLTHGAKAGVLAGTGAARAALPTVSTAVPRGHWRGRDFSSNRVRSGAGTGLRAGTLWEQSPTVLPPRHTPSLHAAPPKTSFSSSIIFPMVFQSSCQSRASRPARAELCGWIQGFPLSRGNLPHPGCPGSILPWMCPAAPSCSPQSPPRAGKRAKTSPLDPSPSGKGWEKGSGLINNITD